MGPPHCQPWSRAAAVARPAPPAPRDAEGKRGGCGSPRPAVLSARHALIISGVTCGHPAHKSLARTPSARTPHGWAAATLRGGEGRAGDATLGLPRIPASPERSARSHPDPGAQRPAVSLPLAVVEPGKVRRTGVLLFPPGVIHLDRGLLTRGTQQALLPQALPPGLTASSPGPTLLLPITKVLQLRGGHPPHPCWGSCQPLTEAARGAQAG